MAKPIELGLVLEGEDARRFHEYMEQPTYTDDAKTDPVRSTRSAKPASVNILCLSRHSVSCLFRKIWICRPSVAAMPIWTNSCSRIRWSISRSGCP